MIGVLIFGAATAAGLADADSADLTYSGAVSSDPTDSRPSSSPAIGYVLVALFIASVVGVGLLIWACQKRKRKVADLEEVVLPSPDEEMDF
jgi:hypothetical protein